MTGLMGLDAVDDSGIAQGLPAGPSARRGTTGPHPGPRAEPGRVVRSRRFSLATVPPGHWIVSIHGDMGRNHGARNVRSYDDRSIAPEHLERILEAGRRVPSASNRQKWDFVLVTDPPQLQELSTVWVGASHLATAKAAIVLVLPEPESERYRTIDQYDLGQATMAMLLAATDLGIGSGHSAVGDQEACRRILDAPSRPFLRLHDCSRLSGRPATQAAREDRPTSL